MDSTLGSPRVGYHWSAYDVDATVVGNSDYARLDYKYWDSEVRQKIEGLRTKGNS